MSGYCPTCQRATLAVRHRESEVGRLARQVSRKVSPTAFDLDAIRQAKVSLAENREILTAHEAECRVSA